MTKGELMEMSNESLLLVYNQVSSELDRRRLRAEAIALHPGNAAGGKPTPLLIRVLKRLPTLAPADLAKIETLCEAWSGRDATT
jgi:hypothetical protein